MQQQCYEDASVKVRHIFWESMSSDISVKQNLIFAGKQTTYLIICRARTWDLIASGHRRGIQDAFYYHVWTDVLYTVHLSWDLSGWMLIPGLCPKSFTNPYFTILGLLYTTRRIFPVLLITSMLQDYDFQQRQPVETCFTLSINTFR